MLPGGHNYVVLSAFSTVFITCSGHLQQQEV